MDLDMDMENDKHKGKKVEYEDALNMTGFSHHSVYTFLLCGSVIVGAIFEIYSLSFLILSSAIDLDTDSAQQGLIAATPLMGIFTTAHTWGYLADTRGRKPILVINMVLSFIAGFCATFSPNWVVLCVLKFISSDSVGCGYLLSQTLLSESTPAPRKHALIILSTTVSLVALGTMYLLPIPILPLKFSYHIPILNIQFNSWRLLNLIFAVPSAISAILVTRLHESPKYLLSEGKTTEALETLRGMYERNTGDRGENYNVQLETLFLNESGLLTKPKNLFRSILARTIPMFKPPCNRFTHLLPWLYSFCMISVFFYLLWLTSIVDVLMTASSTNHSSLTFCGMLRVFKNTTVIEKHDEDCPVTTMTMTIVFGISMVLAVLNVVPSGLANFIDRKKIFIAIQFLAGFALLCVNASESPLMIAGLFLIFLTSLLNYGVINSYVLDIYPTFIRGSAVCILLVMGLAQGKFIFGLVKKLLDNHCEYVFYLFGVFTCIGGLLGLMLPSDEKICKKKKLDEPQQTEM